MAQKDNVTNDTPDVGITIVHANIEADIRSGVPPLVVQFSDKTVVENGILTTWQWTFGDGQGSTEKNPMHTYTVAGEYTVSLIATAGVISGSVSTPAMITVIGNVLGSNDILIKEYEEQRDGKWYRIKLYQSLNEYGKEFIKQIEEEYTPPTPTVDETTDADVAVVDEKVTKVDDKVSVIQTNVESLKADIILIKKALNIQGGK